ncbi:hypothetical protein VB796_20965 [Arcicella sp. LKC2W]|uniref:hypothetical protein n=1 Tax=Arcicella sp. LKC2W TaxID=2984198 RepID=UPI002B21609A|nr:hypothetical protein [Arcicella sp. LKC2W]MEA5461551.1 hypothetical protein [Arcicella sp. LKC2W]
MTIETRFNLKEIAFFIHNNDIVSFPVYGIEYKHGRITYSFMERKSQTLMDNDSIIHIEEKRCYKSIDELAEFYKNIK